MLRADAVESDVLIVKAEVVVEDCSYARTGIISAADRGMLRIDTEIAYYTDDVVLVRVGGCSVRGRVLYSVATGDVFRTCIELRRLGGERRRDHRVPLNWQVRLTVIAGTTREPFEAEILDMSSSGMGLHCGQELSPADTIAVETASCIVFGEVLHCVRKAGGQFYIGARVTEILGAPPALRWLRLPLWIARLLKKPGY